MRSGSWRSEEVKKQVRTEGRPAKSAHSGRQAVDAAGQTLAAAGWQAACYYEARTAISRRRLAEGCWAIPIRISDHGLLHNRPGSPATFTRQNTTPPPLPAVCHLPSFRRLPSQQTGRPTNPMPPRRPGRRLLITSFRFRKRAARFGSLNLTILPLDQRSVAAPAMSIISTQT